jgi:hypothetical protein
MQCGEAGLPQTQESETDIIVDHDSVLPGNPPDKSSIYTAGGKLVLIREDDPIDY